MTLHLRFALAHQIFNAHPVLSDDIATPPGDETPSAFALKLARSELPAEAIAFCAYLLPRREAVWWACQCVRAIRDGAPADDALKAAEDWVRAPDEETRRRALDLGNAGKTKDASTWLALAAGWSGGNIAQVATKPLVPSHLAIVAPIVRPAPHMTAKAVTAAIELATAQAGSLVRPGWLTACTVACVRFVEGGDPRPALENSNRNPMRKSNAR